MPRWDAWVHRPYYDSNQLARRVDWFRVLFAKSHIRTARKSAIEIGAGHGRATHIFVALFAKVIATEPNQILYGQLQGLEQVYGADRLQTHRVKCEDLRDMKTKFMVFSYSFAFVDKVKCLDIIDDVLQTNGHLLVLDTFRPLKLDDEFDTNREFRELVMGSIQMLMSRPTLRLVYMGFEFASIICLFQKC